MVAGDVLYLTIWILEGKIIGEESLRTFLRDIVDIIGMTCLEYKSKIWAFKDLNDDDYFGYIGVQPILESFISAISPGIVLTDTWPSSNHYFLIIASCKKYSPKYIYKYLLNNEIRVINFNGMVLRKEENITAKDIEDRLTDFSSLI